MFRRFQEICMNGCVKSFQYIFLEGNHNNKKNFTFFIVYILLQEYVFTNEILVG